MEPIKPKDNQLINKSFNDFRERLEAETEQEIAYEESEESLRYLVSVFRQIGDLFLRSEGRKFELDENNADLVRMLVAYQSGWADTFEAYYHKAGGKGSCNLYNPIMLSGSRGVGKTLLLKIASRFASITGRYSRFFSETSASELLNAFRSKGNIDSYTYRATEDGKPGNICFNDLGIEKDEKGNSYGTSVSSVVRDFLLARYEIDQNQGKLCHITTNLTAKDISTIYPARVADRLRQYNIIPIVGETRRRN